MDLQKLRRIGLEKLFAHTKEKKTRLAAQAESQMREVARLRQSLVVMELSS